MNQVELIRCLKEFWASTETTQDELAHQLGVSIVTLNEWFTGRHPLRKMHKATENAIRLFLRARGGLK
jgi:DNA-binding XRE family transcriptional regulator